MSSPYPTRQYFVTQHPLHEEEDDPSFDGTIFVSPNIITSQDPTADLQNSTYVGDQLRTVFDRRVDNFITVRLSIFKVWFEKDSTPVEFQINTEFAYEEAEMYMEEYARYVGQLGHALREGVMTVTIHDDIEAWGGGNNDILIHVGQGEIYQQDGILEETLIHESCHTSLDHLYESDSEAWSAAVEADDAYISTYAEDFPASEDLAETFLLYQAVRYHPCSLSIEDYCHVVERIPNRIQYLEELNLDMFPIVDQSDSCDYGDASWCESQQEECDTLFCTLIMFLSILLEFLLAMLGSTR